MLNETRSMATLWDDAVNRVFGFDFFIAYAWADGREYAVALALELRQRGFVCFLDTDGFEAGDPLKPATKRSLGQTRVLLLVGSPLSMTRKAVREEIAIFLGLQRRIVPINLGGIDAEQMERQFGGESIWIHEDRIALKEGPSANSIQEIVRSFYGLRQRQKRRRLVAGVISTLIMLLIATSVTAAVAYIQRERAEKAQFRAERALGQAIDVANAITGEIEREFVDIPGSGVVREHLLDHAYELLDALVSDTPDQAPLQLPLAKAHRNLGQLAYSHGDLEQAEQHYLNARSHFHETNLKEGAEGASEFLYNELDLARTVLDLGRPDEAQKSLEQAIVEAERLLPRAVVPDFTAKAHYGLGDVRIKQGDLAISLEQHEEAMKHWEGRLLQLPVEPSEEREEVLVEFANSLDRVAFVDERMERHDDALALQKENVEILRELSALKPYNGQYRRDLALAISRVGYNHLRRESIDEATASFQETEGILRELSNIEPTNKTYIYDLSVVLADLGDAAVLAKSFERAISFFHEAQSHLTVVSTLDPENSRVQEQVILVQNSLGDAYSVNFDIDEAERAYGKSLQLLDRYEAKWGYRYFIQLARAIVFGNLGDLHKSADRYVEACAEYWSAVEILDSLIDSNPNHDELHTNRAEYAEAAEFCCTATEDIEADQPAPEASKK